MNDFFQVNKRILFILIGFLALFAFVLMFFVVRPLMTDLNNTKQHVAEERELETTLQQRLDSLDDAPMNIDVEQLLLEKKVPSERNIDEYILSLQKLEQYANSHIEQVIFSYDSSIEPLDIEEEESEAESDDSIINDAKSDLEENIADELDETPVDVQAPTFLTEIPDRLEVITVSVIAVVPSYEELVNLVRAIEDQDRVSIVNRMNAVLQTDEEKLFAETEELIRLQLDVSTFYYTE